jgi:hypothetical protein
VMNSRGEYGVGAARHAVMVCTPAVPPPGLSHRAAALDIPFVYAIYAERLKCTSDVLSGLPEGWAASDTQT